MTKLRIVLFIRVPLSMLRMILGQQLACLTVLVRAGRVGVGAVTSLPRYRWII